MPTRTNPKLQKQPNGVYYIVWSEGRRSQRASTRTSDMAEAQKFFGAWLTYEASADTKATTDAEATITELWGYYYEDALRRRQAPERLAFVWKNLEPAFGHLTAGELKQSHVDRYVRQRAEGRIGRKSKSGSIWLELMKLRAAINFGIKKRYAPATAKPDFETPEPPDARDRWLRQEEFALVLAQAERERPAGGRLTRLERFLHIAIHTAARRHVIETLTWDRVDLEVGVIHYREAGTARTNKKRPSVPISRALRPVLERSFAERVSKFVIDRPDRMDKIVRRCAEDAGFADVTPHTLRHSAATWMARRGVPLWQIAGVLGNTAAVVERVYAKHAPDGLIGAVEAISGSAQMGTNRLFAHHTTDNLSDVVSSK